MKALVGAFNQEKALVGAFSVIAQPVVEPMEHYTALLLTCHVCEGGVLRPGGGAVAGPHREAGTRVRLCDVLLERSDAGKDN